MSDIVIAPNMPTQLAGELGYAITNHAYGGTGPALFITKTPFCPGYVNLIFNNGDICQVSFRELANALIALGESGKGIVIATPEGVIQ